MNPSTSITTVKRLAAMAVFGLALLLQSCACVNPDKSCGTWVVRHGVYLVHYHDLDLKEQTITLEAAPFGYLTVCDCSSLDSVEILHVTNDISISASGPPPNVYVGQTVRYLIEVTNNGTENAAGINVEVTLPSSVVVVDDHSLTCEPANGNIVCKNPVAFALTNNDPSYFILEVRPTAPGQLSLTGKALASEVDSNPTNNAFAVETTVYSQGSADASVSMTAAPNPIRNGRELTFSIVVQNAGPKPAERVVLTGFSFADMEGRNITTTAGSCSVDASASLICNIGHLSNASGASATVTIRAFPFKTGTLTRTVTVTSDDDANPANNTASVQVTVNPP